jgi:hypothetical protein
VRRALFDQLSSIAARAEQTLAGAQANGQRYVISLEELTAAEKTHGNISRAQDADPYLNRIREAVAREAQTYSAQYREGSGEGVRYTAFDRYTKLTRQSLAEVEAGRRSLAALRAGMSPETSSEEQLRKFHAVYDSLPWTVAADFLGTGAIEKAELPDYSRFTDRSSGGQEELLVAFSEIVNEPGSRHLFAFALAAFIDIIVFLLAFASGPYFFGEPEQRWCAASAALDSADHQVFVRSLLRKIEPAPDASPRVEDSALTPGERQLCLLLVNKGLAAHQDEDGRSYYLLDATLHENLLEQLAIQGLPLRAATRGATA